MKMKRKTNTLLIALVMTMCLFLLSACGADKTEETTAPESASESTKQQSADAQEEAEETEEPEQAEPEEAEEPEPEEVEEQNNAGTEFLALLQEEYENGFVVGKGAKHTCYSISDMECFFLYDGVIYMDLYNYCGYFGDITNNPNPALFYTYDIASKEFKDCENWGTSSDYFSQTLSVADGNFYGANRPDTFCKYDGNGTLLNTYQFDSEPDLYYFDKGILCKVESDYILLSYDLEKIAEIPLPQREIEHGLTEEVKPAYISGDIEGTLYAVASDSSVYRLNTDIYEWESADSDSVTYDPHGNYYGKYLFRDDGAYNVITGEKVFEWGELYAPVFGYTGLCYFGGDKYLGCKDGEYRWVNLTDLSMSEPLPFPEGKDVIVDVIVLDDTYCAYVDGYGVFLWNYIDGTEETIMLFNR